MTCHQPLAFGPLWIKICFTSCPVSSIRSRNLPLLFYPGQTTGYASFPSYSSPRSFRTTTSHPTSSSSREIITQKYLLFSLILIPFMFLPLFAKSKDFSIITNFFPSDIAFHFSSGRLRRRPFHSPFLHLPILPILGPLSLLLLYLINAVALHSPCFLSLLSLFGREVQAICVKIFFVNIRRQINFFNTFMWGLFLENIIIFNFNNIFVCN